MNGEESYEIANDQKYEKQVKEAIRSLEALVEILQKNRSAIHQEHYAFYYYFTLKERRELLETMDLNSFWNGTEQELQDKKAKIEEEITQIETLDEKMEERYQVATKRIGKPGDPYGIGEIARRVQLEIKSKKKEGLGQEVGEETARE